MRSYFFRTVGIALSGIGKGLFYFSFLLVLPAMAVGILSECFRGWAFRAWKKQDFSGPNPRGWRWTGWRN